MATYHVGSTDSEDAGPISGPAIKSSRHRLNLSFAQHAVPKSEFVHRAAEVADGDAIADGPAIVPIAELGNAGFERGGVLEGDFVQK